MDLGDEVLVVLQQEVDGLHQLALGQRRQLPGRRGHAVSHGGGRRGPGYIIFIDILYDVFVRGYLAAGRENAWGLSSLTEPPRVSGVCTGAKVWSLLLSRRLLLPMWSFFFRSSSRSDMFFILGGTGACR